MTRPASRRRSGAGLARLERLGLGADGGDLVPVGKALRRAHVASLGHYGLWTIAQACGPPTGVSPSSTTSKPWRR